jgi:hypothetical protein
MDKYELTLPALLFLSLTIAPLSAADDSSTVIIPTSCEPAHINVGADALTYWTFSEQTPSGKLVEAVLTQGMVDTLNINWLASVSPTSLPSDGQIYGHILSPPSRYVKTEDDFLLSYPLTVILPSRKMFNINSPILQGEYSVWIRFSSYIQSKQVTLHVMALDDVNSREVDGSQYYSQVRLPYGIDAIFQPEEIITANEQLISTVTRMPLEHDRPEVWKNAVLEWTRLPKKKGESTVVFSPFQAMTVLPEILTAERRPVKSDYRPISFKVKEALRDPIVGKVIPGIYKIRLAMAWKKSDNPQEGLKRTQGTTYIISSQHQTIEVLEEGAVPPARCPVCGKLMTDSHLNESHK